MSSRPPGASAPASSGFPMFPAARERVARLRSSPDARARSRGRRERRDAVGAVSVEQLVEAQSIAPIVCVQNWRGPRRCQRAQGLRYRLRGCRGIRTRCTAVGDAARATIGGSEPSTGASAARVCSSLHPRSTSSSGSRCRRGRCPWRSKSGPRCSQYH